MTLVTIDLGDVAGGHDPDDHVIIRAEAFRESQGGGITSTAEVVIPLVDGVGQAEVEPGPVVVAFRCQAVADTREKRGVVPDEGPVGIEDVLSESMIYTAPVVSRALATINGAVGVAVAGEMGQAVRQATTSAVSAEQSAARADRRATSAEIKVDAYTPRIEALETMNGLVPGEPVDGQTANLIHQTETLTRGALDAIYSPTEPRTVNVFHHGVSPTNSASVNRAAFQAAIDSAPDGATIYQPATSPSERVHIDGAIVPRPGMTVSGLGGRAFIAQETWGAPVFDLPYGEVTISHWDALSIPEKSAIPGTFRDGSVTNAAVVVWLGGHKGHLEDIKGAGFTSVCRATPWDEDAKVLGEYSEGHIFENIEVDGCDWGIVGSGWRNATLRGITGTYNTRAGSGDPGHLIYIAPQRQSRDVMVSDCAAVNGTGGRAYSFKNVDGMDVTSISARSCEGLMDYTAMKNVRWSGLRSLDDRSPVQDGCIYGFGGSDNEFMQVSDVLLEIHPLARAVRIDGINGVWRDITILVSRDGYSDTADINIYGEGNTLQGAYVHNRSAFSHRFISTVGPRTRILAPRAHQTSVVTSVQDSATETVVEYDPAASTLNEGAPSNTYLSNSSTTAIVRITPTIQRTTTSGGVVRWYSSGFSTMQISVTGAGAVTVAAPYDRPNGHEITYEITNDTPGDMGVLSLSGSYITNGTFPSPAPGKTHTITFRYDGVANSWHEIRREIAPPPAV